MDWIEDLIKILVILAMILLMALPFIFNRLLNKSDEKKKISYKRFRVTVFSVIYMIAATVVVYLLQDLLHRLADLPLVKWLVNNLFVAAHAAYSVQVFAVIIINALLGFGYVFLSRLVQIGLKKKDLVTPKKSDGTYTWAQKAERAVIRFFHNETWYFVGRIILVISALLSVAYAVIFVLYLIPALWNSAWVPYGFISELFAAGYRYPVITLLVLWQLRYFLQGISRLEQECPELCREETVELSAPAVDIEAVDAEVKRQFKDYYACDLELSAALQDELAGTDHHAITRFIAQAVESDQRNPQKPKEVYLNCLDRMIRCESSLLVNGSIASEFSMYFLRYLSATIARGDNVVFVCNTESQIDSVYDYLKEGMEALSSLYCKDFARDAVDFDHPIWRITKISGQQNMVEEAAVDDNSILVTTLNYLCSAEFESQHDRFVHLLDTVVFVDTLNTVNLYNSQLGILNTRLKHITKVNASKAKNGNINENFRVRYMSRQVRYICFDDTRTPGLDKVLKNMLSVDFESVDAMKYNPTTLVRCYNYEGTPGDTGRRSSPQFFTADEEAGALINMAVLCLAKGASNVTIFADGLIPHVNLTETLAANMGRIAIKVDADRIRVNRQFYNPDSYSVIIAMDTGDNLPAALRRYIAMAADKPTLVMVFSRPYMLRDYYRDNIARLWSSTQLGRIPVIESTAREAARKILIKANAGGITTEEIWQLASQIPELAEAIRKADLNGVLRGVLAIYGIVLTDDMDIYNYFEYTSFRDFNEFGVYDVHDKILLRRQGRLFELIDGRDVVTMNTGDQVFTLPLSRTRLTQNYIVGQNLLHDGNIYYIRHIDTEAGRIMARLAVGGKNDEAYQYLQAREYRLSLSPETTRYIFPTQHMVLNRTAGDVAVNDVYVSVFRAPMEVITRGYYVIDPHTLAINEGGNAYHSISDPGNDALAKQTYRRYGQVQQPFYASESVIQEGGLVAAGEGAQMMTIRVTGQIGPDVNRTVALAAAMLGEVLHSMFPSVADSIAVCPVIHGALEGDDAAAILGRQPRLTVSGDNGLLPPSDFELVIIEDSDLDLGVVSVLMSAGDDVLQTLFTPILDYLKWHSGAKNKSTYLHYGLDHEPACFDFASLGKLAGLLGDDRHDLNFVELESLIEYETCDFCGKRYAKGDNVTVLEDGRVMCPDCAGNLVGNNKKVLKAHLERAKIFLESTYGITLDDEYEFCFESTVKIANTLKQNRNLRKRGSDVPLKAYVDEKKKIHVECSIPSANLSELLVRELTYVWQLKHLPTVSEELAEGHIALVAIQYLRFLNQPTLAGVRTHYYEATGNDSGVGYRRLVKELLEKPQYNNNPFRYLLEATGSVIEDTIPTPVPRITELTDFGAPYTPEQPDRAPAGQLTYFYRSRLTTTRQSVYDTLVSAITAHAGTVRVSGCSFEDVENAARCISYDRPDLFWFRSFSMTGDEVRFIYGATAEESEVLQRRMDEVIPRYLEGIDDSMSAYDAAIRIHAKVIASVDYDSIALERQEQEGGPKVDKIDYLRSICGVFLNGKAVCEGYARAMQYLLQKCGIECAEAVGYIRKETGERGGAHAWNILKVDGGYYYLDTTWDDSSNTIQSVKNTDMGFDYFCITTDEMNRTRQVDLCPTDMPTCVDTKANYFFHNDFVLEQYDPNKIRFVAMTAAQTKNSSFTFKCTSKALFEEALNRLCADGKDCFEILKAAAKHDKRIQTNSYNYTYDTNIWTITVKFKFKQ